MNVKKKRYHIKNICFSTILLVAMSIGNGLTGQSLEEEYDRGERYRQSEEINIKVFPNPATDYVIVSTDSKFKGNFKLNNIFGKILLEGELNKETKNIDLIEYRTGIYIISIYDDTGQKVGTRKIIKN